MGTIEFKRNKDGDWEATIPNWQGIGSVDVVFYTNTDKVD
jgi:hypothetical protein